MQSDTSLIVSDLSVQNRLLTQSYFIYGAACRSASSQLKRFATVGKPLSAAQKLTEAETLIQAVAKTLDNVIESQNSVPLALEKLEEEARADRPKSSTRRHRHRSPSPSPGARHHVVHFDQKGEESEVNKSEEEIIQNAIDERDLFWRDRIKNASDTQTKLIEAQIRQSITKRFSELIDIETSKLEKVKAERATLRILNEKKDAEIVDLRRKVSELETEVDAGMTIIHQFSQLMKDKASAICQYCRRSGTLPPISTR